MTKDERERLKALAKAAMPGPWYQPQPGTGTAACVCITDAGGTGAVLVKVRRPPFDETAAFIAAARTAVPELIAEVEQMESELHRCAQIEATQLATINRIQDEFDTFRDNADSPGAAFVKALDFQCRHHANRCEELEAEIERLQQRVARFEAEERALAALVRRAGKMTEENAELKRKLSQVEEKRDTYRICSINQREENTTLRARVEGLEQALAECEASKET